VSGPPRPAGRHHAGGAKVGNHENKDDPEIILDWP
jgi:hypothetical protein